MATTSVKQQKGHLEQALGRTPGSEKRDRQDRVREIVGQVLAQASSAKTSLSDWGSVWRG